MKKQLKHLILINGLKRSGKNHTADIIKNSTPSTSIVSFAEPIKEIISDTFSITLEDLESYKNNTDLYNISINYNKDSCEEHLIQDNTIFITNFREILQKFGTEAMKKQFGRKIWAKKGINTAMNNGTEIVVISDFRFMSEYNEAIKQAKINGFTVSTIKVKNKDITNTDLHKSETELKRKKFKFDYKIDNTGKPDIYEVTKNIIIDILSKEVE